MRIRVTWLQTLLVLFLHGHFGSSFCPTRIPQCFSHAYTNHHHPIRTMRQLASSSSQSSDQTSNSSVTSSKDTSNRNKQTLLEAIQKLKIVLEREYLTFFNPMQMEYYSPQVTFDDPMTSLSGVQSYQANVDMLASRTWMGKFLFQDARILLHSISGGDVILVDEETVENQQLQIQPMTTRWTLKLTISILPWKPTAIFSGISVYQLIPNFAKSDRPMIQIIQQQDYWDSINIQPYSQGQYHKVPTSIAVNHFIQQLLPRGLVASQAAGKDTIPYTLLRKGNGYEVRLYPTMTVVQMPYTRREEGYDLLGSFIREYQKLQRGKENNGDDAKLLWNAFSPILVDVQKSGRKIMSWPVTYSLPNTIQQQQQQQKEILNNPWKGTFPYDCISIVSIPSTVVAIGIYEDASVEPIVRKVDQEVRVALARDGLIPSNTSNGSIRFAQYDAVYSMGTRRGEVWIDLEHGGHPW